jgi:hypothetical protein
VKKPGEQHQLRESVFLAAQETPDVGAVGVKDQQCHGDGKPEKERRHMSNSCGIKEENDQRKKQSGAE